MLIAFGLWLRAAVDETPVFRAIEDRGERPVSPIKEVLRLRRNLAAGILARIGPDVLYGMFAVLVLTYATQRLGLSRGQAMTAVMAGSALQVVTIPWRDGSRTALEDGGSISSARRAARRGARPSSCSPRA